MSSAEPNDLRADLHLPIMQGKKVTRRDGISPLTFGRRGLREIHQLQRAVGCQAVRVGAERRSMVAGGIALT